jgi:hypothetical protein
LRSLVGLLSPSTQEERYWFWPLLCLEFIDTCRYSSAPISELYLQIWMWWM